MQSHLLRPPSSTLMACRSSASGCSPSSTSTWQSRRCMRSRSCRRSIRWPSCAPGACLPCCSTSTSSRWECSGARWRLPLTCAVVCRSSAHTWSPTRCRCFPTCSTTMTRSWSRMPVLPSTAWLNLLRTLLGSWRCWRRRACCPTSCASWAAWFKGPASNPTRQCSSQTQSTPCYSARWPRSAVAHPYSASSCCSWTPLQLCTISLQPTPQEATPSPPPSRGRTTSSTRSSHWHMSCSRRCPRLPPLALPHLLQQPSPRLPFPNGGPNAAVPPKMPKARRRSRRRPRAAVARRCWTSRQLCANRRYSTSRCWSSSTRSDSSRSSCWCTRALSMRLSDRSRSRAWPRCCIFTRRPACARWCANTRLLPFSRRFSRCRIRRPLPWRSPWRTS
mmetsp:Transcript_13831/g.45207  ORF Transcript_13831/g.45207 Transcript_13831/m.45207 type:complete len:390 (-) Transcript_13831:2291-3460(-)